MYVCFLRCVFLLGNSISELDAALVDIVDMAS